MWKRIKVTSLYDRVKTGKYVRDWVKMEKKGGGSFIFGTEMDPAQLDTSVEQCNTTFT